MEPNQTPTQSPDEAFAYGLRTLFGATQHLPRTLYFSLPVGESRFLCEYTVTTSQWTGGYIHAIRDRAGVRLAAANLDTPLEKLVEQASAVYYARYYL